MALTPELDALAAQIINMDALISSLDGIKPITVSIGTFSITVDPASMPVAYNSGAAVLRNVAETTILQLREAIATTALTQSQAP